MNICNPSLIINVAGVQKLKTGLVFTTIAPSGLTPNVPTPVTFNQSGGQQVGGQGFISVTTDQIIFNSGGVVELVVSANLSDPAGVALLGVQFAGVPASQSQSSFGQGYATSVFLGQVKTGDAISIVGLTAASGLQITGGTVAVRFDAIQ